MEEEYRLEYFEAKGFERKKCPSCRRFFWSRGNQKICGEPPCGKYSFLDNSPFKKSFTLDEMREEYLNFLEKNGHTRVSPYPVDARWRDDVLLTQASIYDFQPLVTSGKTPPPANPLCISQPCIRMNDIDNVGRTGRHTLAFEMMAHHAFNSRSSEGSYSGEVYWKEKTVELCDSFLDHLGSPLEEVSYIESPWVGGGNAGPAFEVVLRGAELATLVFMDLEQDPQGEYKMKDGNYYSKMDNYIVDTGYGLERFVWMSQGTSTIYDAVYPDIIDEILGNSTRKGNRQVLEKIARRAGKMDVEDVEDLEATRKNVAEESGLSLDELDKALTPLENSFAIADHSRALLYMLSDGIVPGSSGSGYLARLVLRRSIRLAEEIDLGIPLEDLVEKQANKSRKGEKIDKIKDIVSHEVDKYEETRKRGKRKVKRKAKNVKEKTSQDNKKIGVDELVELYDSHGIQPETVKKLAKKEEVNIEIPENFYSIVAKRHQEENNDEAERKTSIDELPKTNRLYYDDVEKKDFEAEVLDVFRSEDEYNVVLDKTVFYPEGGGQPSDKGVLENEKKVNVKDAQLRNGVIIHNTNKKLEKGEKVKGKIDWERRKSLMQAHTATHIVGDAARKVLGEHIKQAGAQKGVKESRLDITHYKRIQDKEKEEIEKIANETIRKNIDIKDIWMDRHKAEEIYGFDLYQGGVPPGEQIRLIKVDKDIQACGGTHVKKTGDIGTIKIIKTERVQDGVERLVFTSGGSAVEYIQNIERLLNETADIFDVPENEIPETAKRFFEEWKERGKEIEKLKEEIIEAKVKRDKIEDKNLEIEEENIVIQRIDTDIDELRSIANSLAEEKNKVIIVGGKGKEGASIVVISPLMEIDAGEIASIASNILGGDGGGSKEFGQGGGEKTEKIEEALKEAKNKVQSLL